VEVQKGRWLDTCDIRSDYCRQQSVQISWTSWRILCWSYLVWKAYAVRVYDAVL